MLGWTAPLAGVDPGIRVASSEKPSAQDAVADVRRHLGGDDPEQLVLFFSPLHDPEALARELQEAFPGIPLCG